MSVPLVEARNLSLIRGQRLLFKDLSFVLDRGQAIHLSGHNGSGKTSLFKVLNGLLPASSGSLYCFGKNVSALDGKDYQKNLYLGHQTAIKHELTVAENLCLNSRQFDGLITNRDALQKALAAVGLQRFANQLAGKLSAGQKRRVMLARLYLTAAENPYHKSLWLLDEPLTALDIEAIDNLQALIEQHLSIGGGVIFTSHQVFSLSCPVHSLTLGERP